jgi:hypothetical protein
VGVRVYVAVGVRVNVGVLLGVVVGVNVGVLLGVVVGVNVGVFVGVNVGVGVDVPLNAIIANDLVGSARTKKTITTKTLMVPTIASGRKRSNLGTPFPPSIKGGVLALIT